MTVQREVAGPVGETVGPAREEVLMGLGVSVMPLENRREMLVETAVAADRLGYAGYFLPEAWAYDVTVLLAEAATRTTRITLGSGILGVWSRTPAQLAMAAATLASLSGGRLVLGLGASTPQLTEGLHDVPFTAPLARMRRTLTQVRALLRGERVPLGVATAARPLKLNLPAGSPEVPLYLAALTEPSVRLAGELADGWIPFMYPLSHLAAGREVLAEGARRAGGRAHLPQICPSVPVVVDADPTRARDGAAWFVSFYVTTMGSLYRQSLARQGFGKEVEAVVAANAPKFQGAVPADAEVLLDELTVYGTPEEACRRLARWYDAGAALPMLLLRAQLSREERDFTLRAFRPFLGAETPAPAAPAPA